MLCSAVRRSLVGLPKRVLFHANWHWHVWALPAMEGHVGTCVQHAHPHRSRFSTLLLLNCFHRCPSGKASAKVQVHLRQRIVFSIIVLKEKIKEDKLIIIEGMDRFLRFFYYRTKIPMSFVAVSRPNNTLDGVVSKCKNEDRRCLCQSSCFVPFRSLNASIIEVQERGYPMSVSWAISRPNASTEPSPVSQCQQKRGILFSCLKYVFFFFLFQRV